MKLGYFLRKKKSQLHQFFRMAFPFYEYFFWFLFSSAKFKKFPKKIKKVLLINKSALGDCFYTLRTMQALKDKYPKISFFFLVNKQIFNHLKFFDKYIDMTTITEEELKNHKFDLTLAIYKPSPKEYEEYKKNFGYIVGHEYYGIQPSMHPSKYIYFNRKLMPPFFTKPYLEQQRRVCALADLPFKVSDFKPIKLKPIKKVDSILIKNNLKKFIVLHPGGLGFPELIKQKKTPAHLWPLSHFSKFADNMINKGYDVVLTGVKDEQFIGDLIIKKSKNKKRIFNLMGLFNVEEYTSLISKSKLVVESDTSAGHVASISNIPVINFLGPGNIKGAQLIGNSNQVNLLNKKVCIACRKKGQCPERNNICLSSITPKQVAKAADKLLR